VKREVSLGTKKSSSSTRNQILKRGGGRNIEAKLASAAEERQVHEQLVTALQELFEYYGTKHGYD
jgi:hypothetical protein